MDLIKQHHKLISVPDNLLQTLEEAGRTCYKSEDKITPDSAAKFVKMLINSGHHAMIEFGFIIVRFITNRGVTHEFVRHRLCSFAQESTRYVNYAGKDIQFILPVWVDEAFAGHYDLLPPFTVHDEAMRIFISSCLDDEQRYKDLISIGWKPQQAREVLPNALKTEIVVGANIREWRHIFSLRCAKNAHPQMSALTLPVLLELRSMLPVVFDDIEPV